MINNMDHNSRVWVYQSSRQFLDKEVEQIKEKINAFTKEWSSHNQALEAHGDILLNRFIILMVDQNHAGASGCSIDKSVYFIQSLEKEYGVDFFDRMNIAYEKDGQIQTTRKEQFAELYSMGLINDDTIVFNNLVENKSEFDTRWKIRLADSWHKHMIEV